MHFDLDGTMQNIILLRKILIFLIGIVFSTKCSRKFKTKVNKIFNSSQVIPRKQINYALYLFLRLKTFKKLIALIVHVLNACLVIP